MQSVVIGSIGVGVLLLAFVLNLAQIVKERDTIYLLLNIIGTGLAGWYAWQSNIIPFVVLEAVWGGAALVQLLLGLTKKTSQLS